MSNIYMVRHGEAAAGFDRHIDPGLSKLGKDQASATAKELDAMGPMQIVTSSLARERQPAIWLQGIFKGRWAGIQGVHLPRYRASRSRFDLERPEIVKISLSRESHASPRSIPLAC